MSIRWCALAVFSALFMAIIAIGCGSDAPLAPGAAQRTWQVVGDLARPPGDTDNPNILDTIVYHDTLIACGISVMPADPRSALIARLEGESWKPMGDDPPPVFASILAMEVFRDELIVGGTAGSEGAPLLSWNGASWTPVGEPAARFGAVWDMTVYDGDLIVAGARYSANAASNVPALSRWNGTTWSSFGAGFEYVNALTVYNGALIAAGGVQNPPGGSAEEIVAQWDGEAWRPLGSGMDGAAVCLSVFQGELIAAGGFATAGGVDAAGIAAWTGTAWRKLGDGISFVYHPSCGNCGVNALAIYEDKLAVGGFLTMAGHRRAAGLALWDGATWSTPWTDSHADEVYPSPQIEALDVFGNDLIVGGYAQSRDNSSIAGVFAWRD